MSRVDRHWPEISICICGIMILLAGADLDVPGRLGLTLLFVAVIPGAAIVRLLELGDRVAEATVAVATSLALALLLAALSAYSTGLSARAVLLALVVVTIAANAAEVLRARSRTAARGSA